MPKKYYIVDNFLDNPDALVESTKDMDFSSEHEGKHFDRTVGNPSLFLDYIEKFSDILGVEVSTDFRWKEENMNCSFYRTYPGSVPRHIHHDFTDWSGILYLSKDIPEEMGTQFWKHIPTGYEYAHNIDQGFTEGIPFDKTADKEGREAFEKLEHVKYKYNRLLLFKGTTWHSACITTSMPNKSRLNQFFYFNQKRWNDA